jgi:hypothetical protein
LADKNRWLSQTGPENQTLFVQEPFGFPQKIDDGQLN